MVINIPLNSLLTLNVLYHTIPPELRGCEGKDVHGLQSFVLTYSEESDSLLFLLCSPGKWLVILVKLRYLWLYLEVELRRK